MDSDKINTSNFDYEKFSSILDAARRKSKKHDYYCCIPGCNKKALNHSHIIPQSALKKYICNDNNMLIQCQIDEIHPMSTYKTGEIPFEKFHTIGINGAMSLPLFCNEHDNDLFCQYEKDADGAEPYEVRFQVLQSLRATCALKHYNTKLLIQGQHKSSIDDFYLGYIYEEDQKLSQNIINRCNSTISALYQSIVTNNFSPYVFVCIELELLKLAVCDVLYDDADLETDKCDGPLNVLFINLIPKNNHSYLILGYDKRYISNKLKDKMEEWVCTLKEGLNIKTLYDILCHCGNIWCISPDCDSRIIEYLKNNYSEKRIETLFDF